MREKLGPKILELRRQGLTYNQIKSELGCSKGTISFHIGEGQKDKYNTRQKARRRKQHPFIRKIQMFQIVNKQPKQLIQKSDAIKLLRSKISMFSVINGVSMPQFDVNDVISKFGDEPVCYLTGKPIDIWQPRTYHFDHIIPKARGGDNSIDNLEICTREANVAKNDMTPDEFIQLCANVLQHNGYQVTKESAQ